MIATHTPGPWRHSTDGTLPIRISAPENVVWKDSQTIVARVGSEPFAPVDFQESLANARVIAAAPALLAALKALSHVATWDDETDRSEFDAAFALAEAAIAAAEAQS